MTFLITPEFDLMYDPHVTSGFEYCIQSEMIALLTFTRDLPPPRDKQSSVAKTDQIIFSDWPVG